MTHNPESAKKAAETLKKKYGDDYFSVIGTTAGRKGGKAKVLKGIAWLKVNDKPKYDEAIIKMKKSRQLREQKRLDNSGLI